MKIGINLLVAISLFSPELFAQTKITGKIIDDRSTPIANVTVQLLAMPDSVIRATAATNEDGKFFFRKVSAGTVAIAVTATGYLPSSKVVVTVKKDQTVLLLPAIVLQLAKKVLDTVVVSSNKPLVERKIDRTIVNIGAMISSAGSNAYDAIENAPGINIDTDGDIALYGRRGVLVLIDDRPTYLSVQDLAAYLKSLPAGLLDRLELMTNPPAKYDAAGSAIINIILKKNRAQGWNGGISAGVNQGVYTRTNNAVQLNLKSNKWNVMLNSGVGHDRNFSNDHNNRYYVDRPEDVLLEVNANNVSAAKSVNIRAGVDFYQSAKTIIGVGWTGVYRKRTDQRWYHTAAFDANRDPVTTIQGNADGHSTWKNNAFNANLQQALRKHARLTADLDVIRYNNASNLGAYGEKTSNDSPSTQLIPVINRNPTLIKITSGKIDYSTEIAKKMSFNGGIKISNVSTGNNNLWFTESGSGLEPDERKTNFFDYKETIRAAYLSYAREWKRWSIQLGGRVEWTDAKGSVHSQNIGQDSSFDKTFTNLFPTVYVQYKIDSAGDHILSASLGKRIRRPNYQQLNPFTSYINEYAYTAGNPFLVPHSNHLYDIEYAYKNKLRLSAGYFYITDIIYNISVVEDNKTVTRPANFGTNQSVDLRASYDLSPVKGWDIQTVASVFHLRNRGSYASGILDSKITTREFEMNHRFRFGKGFSGELNAFFPGRHMGGQVTTEAFWRLDAGVQKIFEKQKLNIRISANDIFRTMIIKNRTILNAELAEYTSMVTDSRRVAIGINYRFGKEIKTKKNSNQNGSAEEEKMRAN
jgi:hypothetical protein